MTSYIVNGPTLLDGVDDATYHGGLVRTPGPQTSQSALKLLIEPSTPREFQHYLVTPAKPKRVFDVGHAAHTRVLGIGAEYTPCPLDLLDARGAMTRNVAKEWAESEREAGRTPLHPDDYEAVVRMADAILEHGRAAELFTDPARRPEVSAFHEATPGLWLRSRFDLLGGGLCDFKTTIDPHGGAWRGQAWRLGYHVQDVSYRRAYEAINGTDPGPMTFICVGKEAPHLVGVYTLNTEFERFGNEQLDAALNCYLQQLDKHGMPDAEGVTWDGLPETTAVLSPPRTAYYDAEGVDYEPTF